MKYHLPFRQLCTLVVVIVASSGLFRLIGIKVRQIECRVGNDSCPAELVDKVSVLTQRRFFTQDLEGEVNQLLEAYPGYQLKTLHRKLPDQIVINLELTAPAYQLVKRNSGETVIVDDKGSLLKAESLLNVPQVYLSEELWNVTISNSTLDQQLHSQLQAILTELNRNNLSTHYLELVANDTVLVKIDDQKTGLLGLSTGMGDVQKLSLVLKGLEPAKLEGVQEIDVRYKLPILRQTRTIPRHDSQ